MENHTSETTPATRTINNLADILVIIGYFILVIGVGVWVSSYTYLDMSVAYIVVSYT